MSPEHQPFHNLHYLSDIRIRPLLGEILSYVPGLYSWWDMQRPTGNTASASYAKSIWQFHLSNIRKHINGYLPSDVVELGPGASLGSCISALSEGVDNALGLDVCPYAQSSSMNLRILNELLPEESNPALHADLKQDIMRLDTYLPKAKLKFLAPWTDDNILPESSIDFIFSHSVLEHVTLPEDCYKACFTLLRPGGVMSHKIDHSSHAITKSWNGHYVIPDWLWTLLQGGKPYLLNRLTLEEHRKEILDAGFEIIYEDFVKSDPTYRNCIHPKVIENSKYKVLTSTFVCRKPV